MSTIHAGDAEFERVDAPDGLECWAAVRLGSSADAPPVSILIETGLEPDSATIEVAGDVTSNFDDLVERAAEYLMERLRAPEFDIAPDEQVLLEANGSAVFEEPEAVVWSDGTWMLRFAEARLRMADPHGIGVNFVGSAPQSIEDLSSAEDFDS